ncbi:hypothetical protein FH972_024053 [Carpinus fangiana]|uniref:Protein kinase domain-containing protein n=1 Tax=Carpinus fangiana TaxID=176857 RepID=A0A5N6KWY3_9ROSI|nr:hypothetical protein FH972_024053 [Carpinus fangiana]
MGGFTLGWTLGSGDPRCPSNVDIVLTHTPNLCSVGQRHCRLVHYPQTNLLLIRARSDTIIDGKDLLPGSRHTSVKHTFNESDSGMTVEKEMGVAVGELMYIVRFTPFSETEDYADQLDRIGSARSAYQRPPSDSATPAINKIGIWRLWQAKWGGSYGTVSQGYNSKTGSLIVAKRVRRAKNIDEVYLVMGPVAARTLAQYTTISMQDWLILFRDVCLAVAHVHSLGIMHRDIKPDNICVNDNPLSAILIDFGQATENTKSDNHEKGTIPFLAPEVIAFKRYKREELANLPPKYDRAVDVWGIGISFVNRFAKESWKEIDLNTWKKIIDGWNQPGSSEDENCLRTEVQKALAWRPSERPTAVELANDVDIFLDRTKHKRKEPIP